MEDRAAATGPLEERADALALLRNVAEAAVAADRGSLVLVTGAAGIGKTRLLAAHAHGTAGGGELLAATGSEHEQSFAHGLTRRLLELRLARAEPAERSALLAGAAGLAEPLFAPDGQAVPGEPALLHGLRWLVGNLAATEAVTLVVDDLQWVDEPSLRFLRHLVEHLDELRVHLVLAVRTGDPQAERPLVTGLLRHPAGAVVGLSPLGREAVARVVGRRLGPAAPAFAGACADLSAGNPFLLAELLRTCAAEGLLPHDDEVAPLLELTPGDVLRAVVARLAGLGPGAVAIARAVGVLGPGATMYRVVRMAGSDAATAAPTIDALVAAELLTATEPLAFAHPLTRSAVTAAVPFAERARLHALAAELLRSDGESAEQIAVHLLCTPGAGEPWRVEILRAAARSAEARGGVGTAVELLERALAEPPPTDTRAALLLELGEAEVRVMAPTALARLRSALELTRDPVARGEVHRAIGRALRARGEGRAAALMLRDAAAALAPDDPEGAERLHCEYLGEAMLDEELAPGAWAEVRRRVAGSSTASRPLLAQYALSTVVANGDRSSALGAAARLLDEPGYLERETTESQMYWMAVAALSWGDAIPAAERHCDAAIEAATRQGSALGFAWASYARSWPRYWRGELAGAEADAAAAVRVWTGANAMYLPAAVAWLAHARIDLGQLDAAAATLADAPGPAVIASSPDVLVAWARSRLARLEGRGAEALVQLDAILSSPAVATFTNPGTCPWRSEGALAALACGDRERARQLAGEELALARDFGAPRQIGIALRVAGLAEGGLAGLTQLTEATDVLADHPARLEYLRALVLRGGAERRVGRRAVARDTLRAAATLADELGAVLLAGEAREELRAAGGRAVDRHHSGLNGLTPGERRVAGYAARGLSNPEIAQTLFVSRKAVEHHLSSVYTKLGISSRRELPAALGEAPTAV